MKYVQQYIDLNNVFALSEGSLWLECLKDISPPDDKEYHWTIFNTHIPINGTLLIIWEGRDKILKGPDKPSAPNPPPPRWNPNG